MFRVKFRFLSFDYSPLDCMYWKLLPLKELLSYFTSCGCDHDAIDFEAPGALPRLLFQIAQFDLFFGPGHASDRRLLLVLQLQSVADCGRQFGARTQRHLAVRLTLDDRSASPTATAIRRSGPEQFFHEKFTTPFFAFQEF